jgi:hypothetical protein
MKRFLLTTLILLLTPHHLHAKWQFSTNGLAGLYYGVTTAKEENKYPNRWVVRNDTSLKADYHFNSQHKAGIHASTTIMFRQDDTNRRGGEYRFYPYITDSSKLGEFYLGYTYNAAYMLHKGAKDITFLKIDDSNATYFLSNPNWNNGYKSTLYATPKSTSIMTDGRAPKFTYITPSSNNSRIGFSYTPDNANRRGMVSRYTNYQTKEDGYSFGVQQKWQLDNSTLYFSGGYGIFNETDKEASIGLSWEYKNFNIATGFKKAYIDGTKNPISTTSINSHLPAYFDNYRESNAWNISLGYNWDNFKTNIAYLNTKSANTRHQDNLILWSNVYSLDKHTELYLTTSYLNIHGLKPEKDNRSYGLISGIGWKY